LSLKGLIFVKFCTFGAATAIAIVSAPAAMAATPLVSTVTTTSVRAETNKLIAKANSRNATNTTSATTLTTRNVTVAKFNTATGILVGATVGVNIPVTSIIGVFGTLTGTAHGRTVYGSTSMTGTVSTPGVTFGTTPTLLVNRESCSNFCGGYDVGLTSDTIVGSSAAPLASLSAYAGTGNVAFTRSARGTTTVTNDTNASSGTAEGFFAFGGVTQANNIYSISYDYLNFANPSFNGSANLSALTLDFGTLSQNSAPVTLNFTLYNIGNINSAGLSLMSIGHSTNNLNFTTTATTFTNGLNGGSSLSYAVTFNPSVLGAVNDAFTFALRDYAPGGIGTREYQLSANATANVIAAPTGPSPEPTAPAPEPTTWAMLVLGFGLVGAGLRHRRGKPAASAA
jgi:hypothetical protein